VRALLCLLFLIDPNSIHVKTYGLTPGAERILTSTQTLSQALFDKIMEVNLNPLSGSPDKETETAFYIDGAFASGSRPGVYPIRIDDNTANGALLADCFLITSKDGSSAEAPGR
jgi:hypothetical protein